MAKSVNRTFLLGHVGKNPEVGTTPGGTLAVNFSLATTDREKDRQGNWSDRTEWHNLVAYGRIAEIVRDYVSKGTQLFIQGKIQTRSWDDKESGQKRYWTEIFVHDLTLLGGGRGEKPFGVLDTERPGTKFEDLKGHKLDRPLLRLLQKHAKA